LTCTTGRGEYTSELNADSMDPLQVVALVIRSREGFEQGENDAVELAAGPLSDGHANTATRPRSVALCGKVIQ
jgi:hypothetical protein